ncbi:MAG: MBL fold metallo-hydrolase [Candidatus Vogelbacteria bacterium CG10_big_fil_rev_8_21_14_0_10_51_16]|uniref:MBL fold metallo-hydrolase n=1 Tax=Candidatus Vogelbacteria bacterium CG10_big_fil_rev_8_21_14_0_10_51_16 TaxID=1975045 RepID=A0A2H0RE90_9BACT|nr:MAG: MBL fold metallo-hydrolase [Candidatus Vogelbacteria bacterium CG10_big_fil_rev_8_21_14_0_10_51_16]
MKITKYGHSCLLVEEKGVRLLFDPGEYSKVPDALINLDAIIITHEHKDHFVSEKVASILGRCPDAQVITNGSVGRKLTERGVPFQELLGGRGQGIKIGEVEIEGEGELHALLHQEWPQCANVGYRIAKRFYHPGDSLEMPSFPVEILALPVAGPWTTIGMSVEFAIAVKPKVAIPIHEGILRVPGTVHALPREVLPKHGIDVCILEDNTSVSF